MSGGDHVAEGSSGAPSQGNGASELNGDQVKILTEKGRILHRGLSLLVGGAVDLTLMLMQHEACVPAAWHAAATVGVLNAVVIVSEKVRIVVS
ncbi:hypothetical protein [Streptomyces sp. NPDC051016]|uniref:hypothetical protein n=1 Tax=Streptomyces sp. NPDC051016 TaxID=3365638 RepID=UPI0037B64CC1